MSAKKKIQKENIEIVINNCFGGFNLSDKALLMLYAMKSPVAKAEKPIDYYGGRKNNEYRDPHWRKEYLKDLKIFKSGNKTVYHNVFAPDGLVLSENYGEDYQLRADPKLIKVVKKLGTKNASGHCAKLKIVRIPADVKWKIEQYDGNEWVAEKHRTWM